MSNTNTKIEWTDATWSPTTGCTKVSAGCKHCYAERLWPKVEGARIKREGGAARPFTDVRIHPERLDAPLHWRKPRRIFVNSMSDLFHEGVPDEFIDRVFAVMALCPQHTFQILTKRPERMLAYMTTAMREAFIAGWIEDQRDQPMRRLATWPLTNVWLCVSVEDQPTADERITLLLQTPAAVRGVSYEPALGPVDFTRVPWVSAWDGGWQNPLTGYFYAPGTDGDCGRGHRIDQIIIGGESGPDARPMFIHWIESIIRQCRAANVSCFVKQLGAQPIEQTTEYVDGLPVAISSRDLNLRSAKGGDINEWPVELRVREFPANEVNL